MCKELDDYIEEVSKVREKKAERKGERKERKKAAIRQKNLILSAIQKMVKKGLSMEEVLENIMDYFDLNQSQANALIKQSLK